MLSSVSEKDLAVAQLMSTCQEFGVDFDELKGPLVDSLLVLFQKLGPVAIQLLLKWLVGVLPIPPVPPSPIAQP